MFEAGVSRIKALQDSAYAEGPAFLAQDDVRRQSSACLAFGLELSCM